MKNLRGNRPTDANRWKKLTILSLAVAGMGLFSFGCSVDESPVAPAETDPWSDTTEDNLKPRVENDTKELKQRGDFDPQGGNGPAPRHEEPLTDGRDPDPGVELEPQGVTEGGLEVPLELVNEKYVPDFRYPSLPGLPSHDVGLVKEDIDRTTGGSIEFGIFHLDVPPGAVDRKTTFSVVVSDDDQIRVTLLPHGTTFDVPVTLTVDLSLILGEVENVSLYWFDEESEDWVNVGGEWNPKTGQLVTQLSHFSDYAPGRAGWSKPGAGKPERGKKR